MKNFTTITGKETNNITQFTEQDAISRVIGARIGALDPQRINLAYLKTFRRHVSLWLDHIDDEIAFREGEEALLQFEEEMDEEALLQFEKEMEQYPKCLNEDCPHYDVWADGEKSGCALPKIFRLECTTYIFEGQKEE